MEKQNSPLSGKCNKVWQQEIKTVWSWHTKVFTPVNLKGLSLQLQMKLPGTLWRRTEEMWEDCLELTFTMFTAKALLDLWIFPTVCLFAHWIRFTQTASWAFSRQTLSNWPSQKSSVCSQFNYPTLLFTRKLRKRTTEKQLFCFCGRKPLTVANIGWEYSFSSHYVSWFRDLLQRTPKHTHTHTHSSENLDIWWILQALFLVRQPQGHTCEGSGTKSDDLHFSVMLQEELWLAVTDLRSKGT